MMKRALTGIASAGILAVTVGGGDGECTVLSPLRPCSSAYTPKAAARFAVAFRALLRFPTPTVRKPQAVVVLGTIKASSSRGEGPGPLYPSKRTSRTWFDMPALCQATECSVANPGPIRSLRQTGRSRMDEVRA
jgi:hypothetical protein